MRTADPQWIVDDDGDPRWTGATTAPWPWVEPVDLAAMWGCPVEEAEAAHAAAVVNVRKVHLFDRLIEQVAADGGGLDDPLPVEVRHALRRLARSNDGFATQVPYLLA